MCTLLWAKLPGHSAKLPGPAWVYNYHRPGACLGLQISQLLPHSLTNMQDLFTVKRRMKLKELIHAYLATQNLEVSTLASFRRKQQLDLSASFYMLNSLFKVNTGSQIQRNFWLHSTSYKLSVLCYPDC